MDSNWPKTFLLPQRGTVIQNGDRSFYIGEVIGRGSFGIVYECTDDWGNELAAKVITPNGLSYQQVQENWSRELSALVELRHPNITFVHAAFECADTFYIIVERCAWPVESMVETPNSATWLPYVARDLLQALAFVHDHGYVHKDVHAGNVFVFHAKDMMTPSKPEVWLFKLGDFGISRLAEEINPGAPLAKWMFAPEALDPWQFGAIGPRMDIYHAALLLLSLAVGRKLQFTREEILSGAPREMAAQAGGLFADPLSRALRRHVQDRTPSATEFWKDLKGSLDRASMAPSPGMVPL